MDLYGFHACEWLVLAIYSAVLIVNLKVIYTIIKTRTYNNVYVRYMEWISALIVAQVLIYMALQLDWILNEEGKNLDKLVDVAWLVYDYMGGVILLGISLAISSLMKLKIKAYQ